MLIVVASGNIFRRELSSYILSEAGYEICEVRTAEALMGALRSRTPGLILIDLQLESADPALTLRAVRILSDAPILWIADPYRTRPLQIADQRPASTVAWPFRSDELLAASAALLGRVAAERASVPPPARYAGSSE